MGKKKCDCIFCNFKCPECGAEEIQITYSPVFKCHNDTKNYILLNRELDRIELICSECGAWIEYDEHSSDLGKLDALQNVLNEKLEIPEDMHFIYDEEHGKSKAHQTITVTREIDETEKKAIMQKIKERKK